MDWHIFARGGDANPTPFLFPWHNNGLIDGEELVKWFTGGVKNAALIGWVTKIRNFSFSPSGALVKRIS